MIRKLREKLNRTNDHGSSFVLVIVATTFMCILVSALLMGTLMTYKLKFYKLNSLNNFYEVETALDEIYAGVGAATNEHLYSAYTTTAELVVVYDTKSKAYVNLTDEEANALFKKLFMSGFMSDAKYKGIKEVKSTLESYMSNQKGMLLSDGSTNTDGVYLDTSNMQLVFTDVNGKTRTESFNADGNMSSKTQSTYKKDSVVSIAFKNVCVKREVEVQGTSSGKYIQSITTDMLLTQPEYNVSFDMSTTSGSSLYDYAFLADMGVEINTGNDANSSATNVATEANTVRINGNIYAASDFYNKDYNANNSKKVTDIYTDKKTMKWGTTDSSLYSGIYVNGNKTNVNISSDVIVCSGTVGTHNGANLVVAGRSNVRSELWADNIVLGGSTGGTMTVAADAFIYDDTELNAPKSNLLFTQGRYFGYSYNAADSRSINYLKGTAGGEGMTRLLATGYKLRSHFSDSAIIVNGKGSTIDLSRLDSLYIAGKSYIEFSKITAASAENATEADGITVDRDADYAYTNLTDYSTGQSLDVKSNQLIFLTQWSVAQENDDGTVLLRFPKEFESIAKLKNLYKKYKFANNPDGDESLIKAIKQEISGHTYYYLYIDESVNEDARSLAEQFAEDYYAMFDTSDSKLEESAYNVRNYENFNVKLILPQDENKVKTSGALTDQTEKDVDGNEKLFFRKSTDTVLNVENALENVSDSKPFSSLYQTHGGLYDDRKLYSDLKSSANNLYGLYQVKDDNGTTTLSKQKYSREQQASNTLSYMYINMKDHLSVVDKEDKDGTKISAWDIVNYTKSSGEYSYNYNKISDEYSYDYSITPISQYVDMNEVFNHVNTSGANGITIDKSVGNTDGTYDKIIVNKGSVVIDDVNGDGKAKGIIIAGGEVSFSSNVKSFKGLIISGSKIKIDHVMDITADANYVATLLKKCAEDSDVSIVTSTVLKNYVNKKEETKSEGSTVSISDISYEDILAFQNWKRNVE